MTELANFMENLESDRFNMGYWVSFFDYDEYEKNNIYQENEVLDINECNTAGCIAGWAVALENNGVLDMTTTTDDLDDYYQVDNIKTEARMLLGLSESQADRLFLFGFESLWYDYRKDYDLTEHYDTQNLYHTDESMPYAISEEEIKPKHVADMLRRIISGEIIL